MREVIFKNPLGEEVHFNREPPYVFDNIKGEGTPDVNIKSSTPASMDGTIVQGLNMKEREIDVYIHIHAGDRSLKTLYKERERLGAILSPHLYRDGALGTLTYINDHITLQIPAMVKKGPPSVSRQAGLLTSLNLVFLAPDPLWRGMEQKSARIAYTDGGFEFPYESQVGVGFTFGQRNYRSEVYVEGTAPTPFTVQIKGPSVKPGLMNLSTGAFIRLDRDLHEDEILTISTDMHQQQNRVIVTRDGETEDAFGYLDLESTFFSLVPGSNPLEYFSEDDSPGTSIALYYYPRYIGA